jgi:hypothetical protein
VRSVDEVVVVVFNTILPKTLLQFLGECMNLALGLVKRVAIVVAAFLTFLRLE